MLLHSAHLDRDRLQGLLSSQLSVPDETFAAEHLETCTACRAELEMLAADPSWWSDASRLLPESPDAIPCPVREPISHADVCQYLEPSDSPAMLGRLGLYEVVEVIGRGGFGIVFKGYDQELNRYVAIKVLAPHLANVGAARQRFAREAQAAAAVVHPHVISIHAVVPQAKLPYLVMPLIAGESLQQRLDREGPLPLEVILRIGKQVADGLAAAHAQGLVHRDVKPANILLERGVDRVVLTDFGLARTADDATLTHSGIVAGTPQYMSPEQARGDAIDPRSDLFSLGSVLYALATGVPPFRASSPIAVLRRICDESPRSIREANPRLPAWLETIVSRLHAKLPESRFANAAEVSLLLEQSLAHVQNPQAPLPRSLRREVWWSAWRVAPVVALLLITGVVLAVRNRTPAEKETLPMSRSATQLEPMEWNSPVPDEMRVLEQDIEALEQTLKE